MTLTKEELKLTKQDMDLYTKFWALMRQDAEIKQTMGIISDGTFTADDLRLFGLTKVFTDPAHQIGSLILRWKENRLITPTGKYLCSRIKSNHGHRIAQYKLRGWQQ